MPTALLGTFGYFSRMDRKRKCEEKQSARLAAAKEHQTFGDSFDRQLADASARKNNFEWRATVDEDGHYRFAVAL